MCTDVCNAAALLAPVGFQAEKRSIMRVVGPGGGWELPCEASWGRHRGHSGMRTSAAMSAVPGR